MLVAAYVQGILCGTFHKKAVLQPVCSQTTCTAGLSIHPGVAEKSVKGSHQVAMRCMLTPLNMNEPIETTHEKLKLSK